MKIIIFTDSDAQFLLAQLELNSLRPGNIRSDPNQPASVEDMHRAFHFVVCRWLQEQGADIVAR